MVKVTIELVIKKDKLIAELEKKIPRKSTPKPPNKPNRPL